jgi:hypothetical protein
MNEILKDVLEERAEHARTPHVDAARLIRAGRRRRTVRRGTATASVAAVAALSVAVTPTVVDRLSDNAGPGPTGSASGLSVPWADAHTLHFGDLNVPRPDGLAALSYAPETDELAYSVEGERSSWEDIYVMSADGTVEQVNEAPAEEFPVSDGEDEFAWLEKVDDGWVAAIRHASGEIDRVALGKAPWLTPVALDDGVFYYNRGYSRVWYASVDSGPSPTDMASEALLDHANGTTAFVSNEQADNGGLGTVYFTNEQGQEVGRAENLFLSGQLSDANGPDDLVLLGDDGADPVLVEVTTGERIPLDVAPQWERDAAALVGDRVLLTAFSGVSGEWVVRLLDCSATTGSCTVVDEQQTTDGDKYLLPDPTAVSRQLEFTTHPPME